VDAAAIACMKPSGVLVNVGRGAVVGVVHLMHSVDHSA
jgi:lactate dehydrogenase-like 2-hydroxyacid dehydrogenase